VAASESAALGQTAVLAHDDAAVQGTDDAALSDVQVGASETVTVGLDELLPLITVAAIADDAPSLSLDEAVVTLRAFNVTDDGLLGLSDVVTFAGEPIILDLKTATDACVLGLNDLARTPLLPAEVVAMLLLESDTDSQPEVAGFWGGGARHEPASYLCPTSVRMTRLPPDQSRGGQW
jgi:hypothetical protein